MGSIRVPFVDLRGQHRALAGEIEAAVRTVLADASFILSDDVAAFEAEFAAYLAGADGGPPVHAVGVGNGLDALRLALQAHGIGPGDDVVVPANTFAATALAVRACGANVVLADCDPETALVGADEVRRALTARTRALMPVHLYGRVCDMAALLALGRERGVRVIEDAAQAHGARRDGRAAGTFADAGCFSFYPSKNLGACGDAGLVATRDAALAATLRRLRNYGQSAKYLHDVGGTNTRLDGIQAAILRIKLRRLDDWNVRRRALAARYDTALAGLPLRLFPPAAPPEAHVHHLYVVRVAERDRVRDTLLADGIETGIHYPVPVHLLGAFRDLGYGPGSFPHAEALAAEGLSLPLYPEMPETAVELVADALRRALA